MSFDKHGQFKQKQHNFIVQITGKKSIDYRLEYKVHSTLYSKYREITSENLPVQGFMLNTDNSI